MAIRAIFRSLSYRNYRLFFAGQSISLIGTWMQRIATPWLVYEMTGSVFLLGLVGFIGQIPIFLIAPFAGVFTDRWNRYHILVATQILAMGQATVLTWLVLAGSIGVWHVILLAGFLGCVSAFDIPARQSFIIQLVDKKEDLSNAIALNSSIVNGARLLGPSVAGMLIAATGVGICFFLNAISYIFVIWSLLLMKVSGKGNGKERKSVLAELQEGIAYTFGFAPIRYVILLLALASLMGMPYTVLMPVFAKEILAGGANTFGFLMGASGVGALTGAFYLASRKSVVGLEKIIPLAAGCFGIGLISLSLSRFFALSLVLMVVTGFGMMLLMASSNTVIQNIVEDSMRGRVMSFFTMAIMGTAPFGSLLAGSVARQIGAPKTIMIGGVFCIMAALVFRSKLGEITQAIARKRQERDLAGK
ncbi:MAG: MFS transporter [Proteobacteria bacterium]|nr:MFS transporter [Pseudomonadota bacterium]